MDIKTSMTTKYEQTNGADLYTLGVIESGKVYAMDYKHIPSDFLKVESASRNQGMNLRLRIPASACHSFVNNGRYVCEESDLTDKVGHINAKGQLKFWNKGEMFEKIITEQNGIEWSKDTIRFDKQGDMRVNGIEIQIKLNSATLVNEKILGNI